MRSRIYNLTAISLAVLYGVVGLTGEALHYSVQNWVAQDLNSSSRQNEPGKVVGYFHAHHPDNHQHFHHHHDHSHATSQVEQSGVASVDSKLPQLKSGKLLHSPHDCPLLTLVSQLRLGTGGAALLGVALESHHSLLLESTLLPSFQTSGLVLARGPPAQGFLA
ncbi:MAG: hypothetical protein KDA57_06365 [Planctomycetales bacterium]|nr:hypothetical protein [Planctomycetales bacterium]